MVPDEVLLLLEHGLEDVAWVFLACLHAPGVERHRKDLQEDRGVLAAVLVRHLAMYLCKSGISLAAPFSRRRRWKSTAWIDQWVTWPCLTLLSTRHTC